MVWSDEICFVKNNDVRFLFYLVVEGLFCGGPALGGIEGEQDKIGVLGGGLRPGDANFFDFIG